MTLQEMIETQAKSKAQANPCLCYDAVVTRTDVAGPNSWYVYMAGTAFGKPVRLRALVERVPGDWDTVRAVLCSVIG